MDIKEIEEKLRSFLTDELEIDEEKIYADSRLKEDMGIDSLEVVDVVALVEETFGFKMQPEDFKTVRTFGQFCDFIAGKIG